MHLPRAQFYAPLTPRPLLLSGCCLPLRAYVVSGGCQRPPGVRGARSALGAQMAEATTADPTKDSGLSWNSHTYVDSVPDSLVRDDNLPGANMDMRRKFEANCRRAQNVICEAIEELDGASFREDAWTRPGGGGGISRVLSNGNVFEKAGCSLSVVYGTMPQEALASATTRGADRAAGYAPGERVPFFACGLSSVMHLRNPMAPTMHFNYRYFETDGGVWWFGGGSDLTPSYLFEEDVKHFHGTYKAVCDKHDAEFYPRFKKWADEYFYIKHRGETRGLGGIFFNCTLANWRPPQPARCTCPPASYVPWQLCAHAPLPAADLNDRDPEAIFAFSKGTASDSVVPAYLPLETANAQGRRVQWRRVGVAADALVYLCVEFNLVYDRGTAAFGLKTGRPHRVDPHVAARDGAMGVLARAGARLARGRHTRRLQERARLCADVP